MKLKFMINFTMKLKFIVKIYNENKIDSKFCDATEIYYKNLQLKLLVPD